MRSQQYELQGSQPIGSSPNEPQRRVAPPKSIFLLAIEPFTIHLSAAEIQQQHQDGRAQLILPSCSRAVGNGHPNLSRSRSCEQTESASSHERVDGVPSSGCITLNLTRTDVCYRLRYVETFRWVLLGKVHVIDDGRGFGACVFVLRLDYAIALRKESAIRMHAAIALI